MNEIKVITNNVARDVLDPFELTPEEQLDFDYLDWDALARGEDGASFFRYKGQVYDLGEFTRDWGILKGSGLPDHLCKWDGYMTDSFFSAIVVRYVEDGERVVVGRVLS